MRVENWQKEFWRVVNSSLSKRFEWGKFDCCTFAIDCIVAVSAQDSFRESVTFQLGKWSTSRQAIKVYAKGLGVVADSILGNRKNTQLLLWGDIALFIDDRGREVIAVSDGVNFICPASVGLRKVPYKMIQYGWSI